jgi:catechol 2,3-dioxygenase-like lactoylglutathione lyase family enzyme
MEQILLESQNKVLGQVKKGALSIRSLNHVSFSVPEPVKTGKFFCEILGFRVVRRPNFNFDGIWLYSYGIQIHLIEGAALERPNILKPNTDHISFEADDLTSIQNKLDALNVPYLLEYHERENLRQLFFKEPHSGIMIEICNCEVFPVQYMDE